MECCVVVFIITVVLHEIIRMQLCEYIGTALHVLFDPHLNFILSSVRHLHHFRGSLQRYRRSGLSNVWMTEIWPRHGGCYDASIPIERPTFIQMLANAF